MKKLILSIALLLGVLYTQAQTVVTIDPPSVTIIDSEAKVIKASVDQIKARTESTITVGDTEYTIDYTDAKYTVKVKYYAGVDNTETVEELFNSTRVSDVRVYMKEELQAFFDNL